MAGFSRFGDYVLLRKLSEDALGESYRAGRVDDAGALRDVALLHLFNGAGLDARRLFDHQRAVPPAGGGSGLPRQLAMGVESGICFVAYEYSAGKDLATLVKRANDGFSSLAAEHALLIVERVAKGLAWLHREHETAHGFVVPELVQVSDEGETKLHGFEVGPALVPFAIHGAIKPTFRSYLSPEVLAGGAPGPRDDVFALGALLLQLLTGTPPGAEESVSARLQRARLVENEQPIPASLQQLIAASLAPPTSRPADAKAWHENLGRWMADSGIRATNFDLAFFVQELFRDELRRETTEREDEQRRLRTPAPAPAPPVAAPAPPPAGATASAPTSPEPPSSLSGADLERPVPMVEPAAPAGRGKLMAGIAALAVLALAGWFLVPRFLSNDAGTASPVVTNEAQRAEAPSSAPLDPTTADGAGGTLESAAADETGDGAGRARAMSLDAASDDLERLIQERASALEERLATEYDQEIATMRAQLEAARKIESEARAALTAGAPAGAAQPTTTGTPAAPVQAAPVQAAPVQAAPASGVGAPADASTAETAIAEAPPADRRVPGAVAGTVPPPAAAMDPPTSAAAIGESARAGVPAAQASPPAATASPDPGVSQPDSATPAAASAEVARRAGAEASAVAPPPANVSKAVAPHLLEPPTPRYPAAARSARRSATVVVKVLVGRDGRVLEADTVSDKKFGFGFDQAALSAARKAVYQPATLDGKPIEQWTTLVLRFEP